MPEEKIPLVSVIIPMYNSAKFIPQALESLLYQTMTNFEVVVVDDCSTDNSVEVVEGFISKFDSICVGGVKLNVIKLPKNSGVSSTPRNIGIQMARGKYIAFLDSDDLFTKTALEELTTLAEKYPVSIVHMQHYFRLWGGKGKSVDDPLFTDMDELTNPKNFLKARNPKYTPDKPTVETNNLAERVKKFLAGGLRVNRTRVFIDVIS
jgi:glycosyltransferase involved in cell wall biosynthesis